MTHGDDVLDPFILTWSGVDDAVSVGDPSAATLEAGEPDNLTGDPITGSWWFKLPAAAFSRVCRWTLIGDGASAGQWQMRMFYRWTGAGPVTGFGDLNEAYSGFDVNNTTDPVTWVQSYPLDADYEWYMQVGLPTGRTPGTSLALAAVNPDYVAPTPDVHTTRAEAIASGAPVTFPARGETTIYAARALALAFPSDVEVTIEDDGNVIRPFRAFAGVSCPDPVVSLSHDFGPDGHMHRWRLYDPHTGERWEFLHSPNQMTSPHRPRSINIFVTPPLYNPAIEARGGMARVWETNIPPYEWSFSGWIRDEEQYEQLVQWTRKVNRVQLTDHFNRTWSIRFKEFDPDEQRPSRRSDWRFDYDIKATMYGAVA